MNCFRKDKTDNNNFVVLSIIERILDKIAALEEIILLGAASATHMSFGAKLRLLSKQLERPFWVNFEAQNDQHALTWYAHVVGVAALLCVAGLFLSYVPQTMPGIVVLGKFLAIGPFCSTSWSTRIWRGWPGSAASSNLRQTAKSRICANS